MRKGFTLIELMIVIAIIAIIAAIAIPNLLESRVTANEAAASASLKSGVFPAQTQFQGGAYQDADLDSRGEYGTIGALAGLIVTTKITDVASQRISLVTGPLATGTATLGFRTANGYVFAAAVPGRLETADATDAQAATVEGAALPTVVDTDPAAVGGFEENPAEAYFVVAAMPERFGDSGRKVYVLSQDGQIRTPSQPAEIAVWYEGAAPTNGSAGNAARLLTGIGDFLGGAVTSALAVDNYSRPTKISAYPTVSK